jgi:glyoxylase-like metal-dependent hydrolase (beta-lactamase superfamily II)
MEQKFTSQKLSPHTWKIVENDPYGQFPFLYVILGKDKCVCVDTGCGTQYFLHFSLKLNSGSGDYKNFLLQKINTQNLPFLIINTHIHFVRNLLCTSFFDVN